MTTVTVMYRRANTSQLSTNDPKHVISNTPTLRSVEQVLHLIHSINDDTNVKPINTSNISDSSVEYPLSMAEDNDKPLKTMKRKSQSKTSYSGRDDRQTSSGVIGITGAFDRVFQVIYGVHKPNKKHKQFTSDGFLTLNTDNNCIDLYSSEGKRLSQTRGGFKNIDDYYSGNRLVIASKELEISNEVSPQEFRSGMYFIGCED